MKVRFTLEDGKTLDAELKAGEVLWGEPVTHASENIGTEEAHVLAIELKETH